MYLEKLLLTDKVALVVGAGGGGLGTHTAVALASAGAMVVAVDLSEERLTEVIWAVGEAGGACEGQVADACDATSLSDVTDETMRTYGRIDCLVNVVGGANEDTWSTFVDYPDEAFEKAVELNLFSLFRTSRVVCKRMIERNIDGRIVNYASLSALTSAPYHAAYGAAKAAVVALTKTMAVELGPHGIRVNAVSPGSVRTPRMESLRGHFALDYASTSPLPRPCEPEEVASAVLFLLSDLASGVTGQTLCVDAGVSARSPFGGLNVFAPRLATHR